MTAPIESLADLQRFLENPEESYLYEWLNRDTYPVYSVLLYKPEDAHEPSKVRKLREYVREESTDLFRRTGGDWLIVVFENLRDIPAQEFRPEEVYDIADFLGAKATDLPCIVFFIDPKKRDETLVVRLSELLARTSDMVDLVDRLARVVNSCSDQPPQRRLSCLKEEIHREWPQASSWGARLSKALRGSTFVALTTIVRNT